MQGSTYSSQPLRSRLFLAGYFLGLKKVGSQNKLDCSYPWGRSDLDRYQANNALQADLFQTQIILNPVWLYTH